MPANTLRRRAALGSAVAAVLIAGAALLYWPVRNHGFLPFDDSLYITRNPWVLGGFSAAALRWAFTEFWASNWHPLTWVSHLLDVELFGLDAGRHHLMNAAIHALNGGLLFFVLRGLTGALWRSALVAGLFLVHPLNVESVAWAAERKAVLSTLCMLLATAAWVRHLRRPSRSRYLISLALFALGLMAKPMLVTLPAVFLLLDYWPLSRLRRGGLAPLVREKAPLLLLAAGSSVVTYLAQQSWGSVGTMERFSLGTRLLNAVTSYAGYLKQAVWPSALACFYPYASPGPLEAGSALIALATASAASLALRRRHPYLLTGWLWYLGTMLPVIGLVQVGEQAMADRYAYLPLIGIFLAAAWGGAGWCARRPGLRAALVPAALAALLALSLRTRTQIGYWKDGERLFTHALAVTVDNHPAHNNLGIILLQRGDLREAERHFREAVRIKADFTEALLNLGVTLFRAGDPAGAIGYYRRVLQIKPDLPEALANLGLALGRQGELEEAIARYRRALELRPDLAEAHQQLGQLLARAGRGGEASRHFLEARRLNPRLGAGGAQPR